MLPRADLRPVEVVRQDAGAGLWGAAPGAETVTQTLGWIQPAPTRRQAQLAAAGLPVPAFVAYLVPSAPVREPDFILRSGGVSYHPIGDAEDVGGVGEYWRVPLRAPGEVTASG